MTSLAAIDVGSNAIRMAIGSVDSNNNLLVTEDYREAVRLGEDVFKGGFISEEAMRRAEAAFVRFRNIIKTQGVKKVRAVGTSALREARNRDLFLKRILDTSGIRISIISGEEEARLVYAAVAQKFNFRRKLALLVDIGGGSVEILLVRDGDIIVSDSVKMGTVRLLNILGERKRGQKIFYRLIRAYADGLRRQLRKELRHRKIDLCIGTGGNIEAFGDLRSLLLKKNDRTIVNTRELDEIVSRLESLSYEERISKLDLRPDRADVIIPASIMIQELMNQADIKELNIPRVGLKDGILLDMLPDSDRHSPEKHQRQVLAFARELGRKFSFDEEHGLTVSRFAVALFDQTKELHKLPVENRLLLEVAALLHDIGQCININGHHKHSYYLLKAAPFVGLNDREKGIVAVTARYHRKAPPKMDHAEFASLMPEDREIVTKLAAILRLADALDSEHASRVSAFRLTRRKAKITFSLRGNGDLLLERWALASKASLFEETFRCKISVAE
ncbi:MAG: Ppx/GppA family phosphatase [Deltaproteobacteria bacterium]|nr:Ppx/GppA family phosphatase [Deltaproteobacteria bacterium]